MQDVIAIRRPYRSPARQRLRERLLRPHSQGHQILETRKVTPCSRSANRLLSPPRRGALPGRLCALRPRKSISFYGHALKPPFPHGIELVFFGLGCFWGAERKFWQLGNGIFTTAVGYAGGLTPNPTYEEVCSGITGHDEVVHRRL